MGRGVVKAGGVRGEGVVDDDGLLGESPVTIRGV